MATGLTYDIHDGKPMSFEKFVWRCARMMTPLILMREEDLDALPPDEFKPLGTEAHQKRLAELRAELAAAQSRTDDDWAAAARSEYEASLEEAGLRTKEIEAIRQRYEDMLAKIDAWSPPSKDHEPLKKYMREQITSSIEHDCYQVELPRPPNLATMKAERIASIQRSIDAEIRHAADELQRTAFRNAWVKTLRASVPYPERQ